VKRDGLETITLHASRFTLYGATITMNNNQFIFFSGKGGVGKTSMACTTAVRHADEGRRTLIVTTDPAANLSDVFEQPIGHKITPIANVDNLWAMEIDGDRATEEYIDRAMSPIRDAFPPQMVAVMEEQMSGPCTAEVAAFDRFVDFLEPDMAIDGKAHGSGPTSMPSFDTIVFDTAPPVIPSACWNCPANGRKASTLPKKAAARPASALRLPFRMPSRNMSGPC
jgi:hypothetical protein